MTEVRNINKKRIGDLSVDKRVFVIRFKDCTTKITVRPDGTLNITHQKVGPAA